MKSVISSFINTLKLVGKIFVVTVVIWWIVGLGSFFLNLFGILNYDPPINRNAGAVICVELIDASDPHKKIVLQELKGEELEAFLRDFLKVRFKRYANDPPSPHGIWMINVYYEDGSMDCIRNGMNERFDSSGESIPAGGWYYCPGDGMKKLFEKYAISPQ